MLTGFKNRVSTPKVNSAENEYPERLALLSEAVRGELEENTQRVYIQDDPYLVEFRLPSGFNLEALKRALDAKNLKSIDSKVVGEMLIHTFKLLSPTQEIIEVLYKPLPRMRM